MTGFLGVAYLWVKSAHIIFVIFWIAGLFMLPRFFIYHQDSAPGSAEDGQWLERERRLLRIILNPALILVWIFGLLLAMDIGAFSQSWFQVKLLVVLALSAYHMWLSGYAGMLGRGERRVNGRTLRLLNEVPGIAVTLIVVLVIIRPFA